MMLRFTDNGIACAPDSPDLARQRGDRPVRVEFTFRKPWREHDLDVPGWEGDYVIPQIHCRPSDPEYHQGYTSMRKRLLHQYSVTIEDIRPVFDHFMACDLPKIPSDTKLGALITSTAPYSLWLWSWMFDNIVDVEGDARLLGILDPVVRPLHKGEGPCYEWVSIDVDAYREYLTCRGEAWQADDEDYDDEDYDDDKGTADADGAADADGIDGGDAWLASLSFDDEIRGWVTCLPAGDAAGYGRGDGIPPVPVEFAFGTPWVADLGLAGILYGKQCEEWLVMAEGAGADYGERALHKFRSLMMQTSVTVADIRPVLDGIPSSSLPGSSEGFGEWALGNIGLIEGKLRRMGMVPGAIRPLSTCADVRLPDGPAYDEYARESHAGCALPGDGAGGRREPRTFVIADTHFNDADILAYEGRPFGSVEEMDDEIVRRWNIDVRPGDTVWLLGDVGKEGEGRLSLREIFGRLNGDITLVRGNHDTLPDSFYVDELGIRKVYDHPVIVDGFWILSHEPAYVGMRSPYANVYGHVHGNPSYATTSPRSRCVSVERTRYRPVELSRAQDEVRAEVEAAGNRPRTTFPLPIDGGGGLMPVDEEP